MCSLTSMNRLWSFRSRAGGWARKRSSWNLKTVKRTRKLDLVRWVLKSSAREKEKEKEKANSLRKCFPLARHGLGYRTTCSHFSFPRFLSFSHSLVHPIMLYWFEQMDAIASSPNLLWIGRLPLDSSIVFRFSLHALHSNQSSSGGFHSQGVSYLDTRLQSW